MTPAEAKVSFYVIAHEPGAENPSIPTWANHSQNPAGLDNHTARNATRIEIEEVPGAFQLINLASADECRRILNLTESLGYLPDAAVSLPRSIRHNDSFTWLADKATHDLLWQRFAGLINQDPGMLSKQAALGLNARFRFYRYGPGDYFEAHTDGSWPGSEVIDGELVADAYGDRMSQLTFLLFLSDSYEGGRTQFYIDPNNPQRPARDPIHARLVSISTPLGSALCFPHGMHPLHCLHRSETITAGTKYILRSYVLFSLGDINR